MFLNQTTKFLAALVRSQKLHVDFSAIADLTVRTHVKSVGLQVKVKTLSILMASGYWENSYIPLILLYKHYATLVGLCAGHWFSVPCLF